MDIEFDPAKDAANSAKHGVSLILGAAVLVNHIGESPDARWDYGEQRMNAFGFIENRLFVCTYTMRGEVVRVISARKASRKEQRRWFL